MLVSKKFLDKVNSSLNQYIYLVNGEEEGRATWHYILVDKLKLPVFQQKCKNQEAFNLDEYGRLLKSGFGERPPAYIQQKIEKEGAEYSDAEFQTNPNPTDMNYYVKGYDADRQLIYTYTVIPAVKVEEFLIVLDNGGCNMSDYGIVIESGWGEPPDEVMAKMEGLGFTHEREFA